MNFKCATSILLGVALVFVVGCSGIKPYKNNLDKNLSVSTTTSSGSFFTSVDARVDIYAVDAACQLTYNGTIDLDRPQVEIGLPYNQQNYLNFVFTSSGFLSSSQGSTGFDAYLKTRSGFTYLAEVSYDNGIYDVIIKEKKVGGGKPKELAFIGCTPK